MSIPTGWQTARLLEVTAKPLKVDPATTGRDHVQYVDIGSLEGPEQRLSSATTVVSAEAPSRCRQVVRAGDTIYSTVRPYLRKMAYIGDDLDGEFASTGFCVLRPRPALEAKYLYHWCTSAAFEDQILPLQKGVSYPAVLDKEVRATSIHFPSRTEQRRIVELVEEHLSHLDAADAALSAAGKRSVVLTEAALARELVGHPRMVPLREVLAVPLANGRSVPTAEKGAPLLRLTALRSDRVDLRERKTGAWSLDEARPFFVRRGDFLVSRGNGSKHLVGRGALVVEEPDEVAFPDTAIRVRPDTEALDPNFLALVWNSIPVRQQIEQQARTTAGIYKVNQKLLGDVRVPVPEPGVQQKILQSVSSVQQENLRLATAIAAAEGRSALLRRAVLAAAFSGRLTGSPSDTEVIEESAANLAPHGSEELQ